MRYYFVIIIILNQNILFSFFFFYIFRLLIGAPPFDVVKLVLVKVAIQTTVEMVTCETKQICTGPCGGESSFHSARLLGHNRTSKSVKVPIFLLALNATVAGYMTARTTFKVLSFFGWMLTV